MVADNLLGAAFIAVVAARPPTGAITDTNGGGTP